MERAPCSFKAAVLSEQDSIISFNLNYSVLPNDPVSRDIHRGG